MVIWGPPGRSCDEAGREAGTHSGDTLASRQDRGPTPESRPHCSPLAPSSHLQAFSAFSFVLGPWPSGHDSERLVVTPQTHGRDIIYIRGFAVTDPRRPVMGLDPSSVSSAHQHSPERPVKGARGPAAAVPPCRAAIGSGPADPVRGREGAGTPGQRLPGPASSSTEGGAWPRHHVCPPGPMQELTSITHIYHHPARGLRLGFIRQRDRVR